MKANRSQSGSAHRTLGIGVLVLLTAVSAVVWPASATSRSGEGRPSDRSQLNLDTFDAAWRMIDERFWDPEFGGVDWQAVRAELRPLAERAEDGPALRRVLNDMIGRLGQSHFGVIAGRDRGSVSGPSVETLGSATDPEDSEAVCREDFGERLVAALRSESRRGDATPGFDVRLIDEEVVIYRIDPSGPAARAGIASGWSVLEVDGQPLANVARCLDADLPQRAQRQLVFELVRELLEGEAGDRAAVVVADAEGNARSFELEREVPSDAQTVRFGNLPPMQFRFASRRLGPASKAGGEIGPASKAGGEIGPASKAGGEIGSDSRSNEEAGEIGYIRFNVWMMPVARAFEDTLVSMLDTEGMVLDLRGNPGGVAGLSAGLAGYFVDTKDSLGKLKYRRDELELRINPRRVTRSGDPLPPFTGPLAILIDQFTASTSEIFAAGLQDYGRARIFGERSAAAALPAVVEELPNGDFLMHALADLERPNGERIEGVGVVPDEIVSPTREGLLAGDDEVLDQAVEWIRATAP